ncbi:FAD-dependent oxidoreductase [Streptomyces sp. NBC_00656]|uniref:FAD-dependent oxidoreductase n=1 Tax=unclassified Streptomyces TaxID=2593676 RepID=UPI002E0E1C90|nr:FAD-dependent oxidoreductase [Streptomyces sp. NBC_01336]
MGREADIVVVGAGPGGIACAIAAAEGGSRVVLLEKTADIGGALPWSGGHLSAGGFSLQRARGIEDDPERHWQDIARISAGTGREDLTRLSLAEQPSVLEWLLDAGFAVDPTTPRIVHGHEQYLVPRTVHALEVPGGPALLTVLRRLLAPHLASGTVRLLCGARAAELCADPDGRVAGVRTEDGRIFGAPAVVLATGGFGHDPELFAELDNAPLTTSAAPTATGDGIRLGRSVGAGIQGRGKYLPTFGGLPPEPGTLRVDWVHRPQLVAPERPPWEVYVDVHGRRWTAEDDPSIDRKERALARLDRMTFWTVFDARALRTSRPMVHGWTPEEFDAVCGRRPGLHRAPDVPGLARLAGIAPGGLAWQVARYNGFVAAGRDPEFGRTHLPAPLVEPPFYAVENRPVTVITFAGLDVDTRLRVLREDGRALLGLYAVGEVIGSAAVNGNSFCSGMCLTPAMAFGRILGRALAGRPATPGPAA